MCGIAGYVGPAAPALLPAMLAAIEHRGPDGRGLHEAPGVGLGTARLAIIDLVGGQQPMADERGSIRVVFNGEIYNHRALRAELTGKGHRFATTASDTETIVHLYEEEGEGGVTRLRGMFAFALWDAPRRRLLLARDRLGKKPLYYWQGDGLFLFASEIKALLRHPGVRRCPDAEALHHVLAFGYTPADRSILAGVGKLPPGHIAVLADGRLDLRPYWGLPAAPDPGSRPMTLAEAGSHVRECLREAVRLRLESDVPLGVFLSGGIDSSAIVASMRELTGNRIATFSIGFGGTDPSYDELPFARLVARRFETDHHEEILEPKVEALLPAIVRAFDEPFADSSAIPTFVVAQATAGHVKVALSGIGGDELFAGYPRYLGLRLSQTWARIPAAVRAPAGALATRLVPESDRSRNWADWIRRFVAGSDQPLPDRYLDWVRLFSASALAALATPALRETWRAPVDARQRRAFAAYGHGDPLDGAFRIDLTSYLPENLLVMADRMSMAHSLEVRAPFCDHRLLEESLGLRPSLKLHRLRLKGLLKAAFRDVLPAELLSRPKQGFMIPLARWLRTDLRHLMDDLLETEQLRRRGLFEPTAVDRLRREHLAGRRSHADRLWTLMMVELWTRLYLDGATAWRLS